MTEELTLRVTDLEKKAIAFCREKDIPFPIANYLVDFATEVTEDFEKENAELKEQNIKDCENFNKTMKETKEQWNNEHHQLTKAKEIMKRLVDLSNSSRSLLGGIWHETVREAEDFLKETEE